MELSSLILLEIESNEFLSNEDLIITLERLLYFWTDERTVPLNENLSAKLNWIEEPVAAVKALSSSESDAGIFAEKLLNKVGLGDVTTCDWAMKVTVSNMHSANSLDMFFIVWNFGFSCIGQKWNDTYV